MARRKESILDDLIKLPWWVSIAFSAAAFVLLRYIVPLLAPAGPATSSNYPLKGLLGAAPMVAPFIAFFLLIPAPIAALRQWRESRLLDSQDGLETIRTLSWQRFETLVTEAYRRQGYTVSRPAGDGAPDGGVDLVLQKDRETTLVQCKQWKVRSVGVRVVRELFGVMTARKAQNAILVTSGIFTQDARTFAEGRPIDLVGGHQLAALIHEFQNAPTSAVRSAQSTRPLASNSAAKTASPAPEPQAGPPRPTQPTPQKVCPRCGAEMVVRQRGPGRFFHYFRSFRAPSPC